MSIRNLVSELMEGFADLQARREAQMSDLRDIHEPLRPDIKAAAKRSHKRYGRAYQMMANNEISDSLGPVRDHITMLSAFQFAAGAHNGCNHKRKYTHEPYINHCIDVADMVYDLPDSTAEMVAAAYLHDTLEDTDVTYDQLVALFGVSVAQLVLELTNQYEDSLALNRPQRKEKERARLVRISPQAQTIKYADIIDNVPSIAKYDHGFARVYLPEKEQALRVMTQGDAGLRMRAYVALKDAMLTVIDGSPK